MGSENVATYLLHRWAGTTHAQRYRKIIHIRFCWKLSYRCDCGALWRTLLSLTSRLPAGLCLAGEQLREIGILLASDNELPFVARFERQSLFVAFWISPCFSPVPPCYIVVFALNENGRSRPPLETMTGTGTSLNKRLNVVRYILLIRDLKIHYSGLLLRLLRPSGTRLTPLTD